MKDVGGLEIAVKNAEFVGGFDAVGYLPKQVNRPLDRQRSLATKQSVQRLALDIFHHEIKNAVGGLAKIGDADRIRMLDGGSGLGLAFEPGDRLALLQVVAAQNVLADRFYGQLRVANFLSLAQIYLTHRTAAETAFEQISFGDHLRPGSEIASWSRRTGIRRPRRAKQSSHFGHSFMS